MTSQDEQTHAEAPPRPTPHQEFLTNRNGLMSALLEHGSLMEAAMLRQQQDHMLEVHQLTESLNEARSKGLLLELELSHRPAALPPAPAPEPVVLRVDDAELERLRGELREANEQKIRQASEAQGRISQLEGEKEEAVADARRLEGRIAELDADLQAAASNAAPSGASPQELAEANEELDRLNRVIAEKDAEIGRIAADAEREIARLGAELETQKADAEEQLGRAAAYVEELQGQIPPKPGDVRHFLAALAQRNPQISLAEALPHLDQAFGAGETHDQPSPAAASEDLSAPGGAQPAPALGQAPIQAFDPTRPWVDPAQGAPAQSAPSWEPPAAEGTWTPPGAAAPVAWGESAPHPPTTGDAPDWGTPWTADDVPHAQPEAESAFDFDKAIAGH